MHIIFIHGNGGGTAHDGWLPATAEALESMGYNVTNKTFPDNEVASASIWLPYLEKLENSEKTIIVGHSSGAVAAMRYAETHQIEGSVLVGACFTDLGDELEKKSGYYNKPWNWEAIKSNQSWIMQFASTDDPYIPIQEARFIHEKLGSEYYEFTNRGHFMENDEFTELVEQLKKKLSSHTDSR